jgi:geranylgeranyl diphosphate synthase, type II
MIDLKKYIEKHRRRVNDELARIINAIVPPGRLQSAMKYAIEAGGKRLRPILCLAAAETVDAGPEGMKSALTAGCALELIHTYSLIHDDLPAIDNDDLRRGQPTCHVQFGEATAIFAGDAMHTLAFQLLSADEYLSADPRKQLQIIHIVARATGNDGMIEGQMRDMMAQGKNLTLEELRAMHRLKTGALIVAAVKCGAISGTDDPRKISCLEAYGENIGLAFQVVDDILDIQGDTALLGKKIGADRERGKATYPEMLGMEKSQTLARSLIDNSIAVLDIFDKQADPLRALANYIVERQN